MNDHIRRILNEALELPEDDRAELAASLLESLDHGQDDNVREAWDDEIERRIAEIDRGDVKLLTWSEARPRLFGKYDDAAGT
jgi:putative addiction module component (TIGR02574 family)